MCDTSAKIRQFNNHYLPYEMLLMYQKLYRNKKNEKVQFEMKKRTKVCNGRWD